MAETTGFDKPFKSYDQMIDLLKSRNIIITNEDQAKYILSRVSYYTLINGYKHLFTHDIDTNVFNPPIAFEDFHFLSAFESQINNILFRYILAVEQALKSSISYIVSERYALDTNLSDFESFDPADYLSFDYYQNTSNTSNIIERIKMHAAENRHVSIKHYRENHNHLPCWILVNGIPFGDAISWYSILGQDEKIYVCKQLLNLSDPHLALDKQKEFVRVALKLLCEYRNDIAHGDIVFGRQTKTSLPKYQVIRLSKGTIKSQEYNRGWGKNDLLAVIFALSVLSSNFDRPILLSLLTDLFKQIENIQFSNGKDIYKLLNLPKDLPARLDKLK